ncbi:histidinol-phosphatase [Chitinimonas prasina]|uniref:Histidinol-phosphatase n=1 Tax=Chitinimonas prasina TaxID=1434937 RepID=A0ABQ5YND7_9NEIS|nr:inositol monophosphatase family protein [Chitinimonas prasina]GLR14890.1 histidinol-phosphatase [Chitinimonas prasina]
MSHPADFLPLAQRLADAARAFILPYYRTRLAVDDKLDASPVTLADRGAEQAMRALLAEHTPEHGIIGEEFGRERDGAEWVWVLDPVDGTKSFIVGRPTFCTLIGLLHHGKPVLGIIDQPVLNERWVGVAGLPTTLNGSVVQTSDVTDLAATRLGSTGPQYLQATAGERFAGLQARCRFTVWGGDAYLYALLACGGYDLVVESGLKLHDFAALVPVVQGAGGTMTDWLGGELNKDSDGSVLVAATAALHEQALAYLR